jgi:succinate dehydrogenase / fumarate reductase cytochrome b subunit
MNGFHWARLGSLVSFLPLGVWTVNHLWDNLAAFEGKAAWERSVTHHSGPLAQATVLALVLLPLLIHTVWGLARVFSSRPNNGPYNTYWNAKYLLQRLSGVGLALFLGAHLWLALIKPRVLEGHPEYFEDIASHMRFHGPTLGVYVLGVLGIAYHLANGLAGLAWTWGLSAGRRSFVRQEWLVVVTFVALSLFGLGAVYALWEAGAAFGPPAS